MFVYVNLAMNLQVQPDLEELTTNMEDNEGTAEKEEVNLGKLQFSMDYDFQKSEVRFKYFISTQERISRGRRGPRPLYSQKSGPH